MNSNTRSWGNHYSRYHQDPDHTVELAEINRLRNEHEYMEKGWQHVHQYHRVRHISIACCMQTGLRTCSKTPGRKCNLKKIEEIETETAAALREAFGDVLDELDADTPLPSARQVAADDDNDAAADDDDDCHYGVHMCMAF